MEVSDDRGIEEVAVSRRIAMAGTALGLLALGPAALIGSAAHGQDVAVPAVRWVQGLSVSRLLIPQELGIQIWVIEYHANRFREHPVGLDLGFSTLPQAFGEGEFPIAVDLGPTIGGSPTSSGPLIFGRLGLTSMTSIPSRGGGAGVYGGLGMIFPTGVRGGTAIRVDLVYRLVGPWVSVFTVGVGLSSH